MLYSYFFDPEKTHRLEFALRVLNYTRDTANNQAIVLLGANVTEIIDNVEVGKQTKIGTFYLNPDDQTVDTSRIRVAEQNKWIFEIKNNRRPDESIVVGLITKTTAQNPIGLDIININSGFEADLRANNLAILEANYVPPVLEQTILEAYFTTSEWPKGFSTESGVYDSDWQLYTLKDFKQSINVEDSTAFSIQMNIAPIALPANTNDIFQIDIDNVGTVTLMKGHLKYVPKGADPIDGAVLVSLDKQIAPDDFYAQNTFLEPSKMLIEGDGISILKFAYAGKTLYSSYSPIKPIDEFKLSTNENIEVRLDNLIVKYFK